MEDGPSSSALPWLWVIEYLACFPQVKASLLHAVLEVAPELPDDLGKDMREVVALRCLEELCGPRIASADEGSGEETGSKLDISVSCEEVLASVFHDDSVSDLREAEKELLKWDMNSFLEHKRASMTLTYLQRLQMKRNSSARSQDSPLKDIGGLASCNTEGQASGDYNEPGLEPNGKNRGDREEGVTGNLIPTSMEQMDCDNARTSPRAKRRRTDPDTENPEESPGNIRHGNGSPLVDHPHAKTLKPCLPSDLEASDPTIVPDSFDSPPRGSTNVVEDEIRTSAEGQILGGQAENFNLQTADSPRGYKNRADNDDLLGNVDATSIGKEKINVSTDPALNKEMESSQTECLPACHEASKERRNLDAFFKSPLGPQLERLHLILERHRSINSTDEISNECEHMFPKGRRESRDHVVEDDNSNKKGTEGNREKGEPSPHMCREKNNQDFSSRQVSKERENNDADKTNDKNPELESEIPEVDAVINQQDTSVADMADYADNLPHPMTNAMGISENVNKEPYNLRGRGSKEVCITPIRRRTRQKKAKWTAEEDIILKEGVEKYNDRNGISWMKILASNGIFAGRTTMDLKNRWNNTRIKEGK
ncbi:hypothetical protein MLD38_014848 [Melastoma candidum]|uniref:Uncharacterized protein n=1 Tax=Melastoma candidum TaxID=119954 RepID=A0ACB9RDQ1_9MYRT|nr:hypothetical protein MLD38_014848 [Melastoma candidum]